MDMHKQTLLWVFLANIDISSKLIMWTVKTKGHVSPPITVMASQITGVSIVPSKLRVTGLCQGNSPVTSEVPHTNRQ